MNGQCGGVVSWFCGDVKVIRSGKSVWQCDGEATKQCVSVAVLREGDVAIWC